MSISSLEYQQLLVRLAQNNKQRVESLGEPVDQESDLSYDINEYCDSQWPKWKVVEARRDKRSTIAIGSHDKTVYMPHTKVLCLELKSKTGKLTKEQLAWREEMRLLGFKVHEVRSMEDFFRAVKEEQAK